MKVEILCVTMHQTGLEKYKEMNLETDAVFANQAQSHEYVEDVIDGKTVKMITTPYRGVGNNRNMALLHSSGDILMLADDDIEYVDGYSEGVKKAFQEHPDADMMIFQCFTDSDRHKAVIEKVKKVRLWNFMRYGTYRFVIRRESLLKYNLSFTHLFGGGCRYGSGEDSLFLRDALKKGMNVYSHPFTIATVNDEDSTWFEGYNEKFFFDTGAWLRAAFPLLEHLFVWYYVFKLSKKSSIKKTSIMKLFYAGITSYYKGLSYDEWRNQSGETKK